MRILGGMNATATTVTRRPERDSTFADLTRRLNRASVAKRYDPYEDVDWDGPDSRIDPTDPRFRLAPNHPLGATEWYRSLTETTQSALGLDWMCHLLRYGIAFESCLTRGLLEFAAALPDRSPEYRYAMHEVVEESHHSMMFQEFIDRSGRNPAPLPGWQVRYNRRIVRWAATFPELFFFHVLSGEIFIDEDNRARLARRSEQHPVVRRILQIHVTEEARHVCFAEAFLRERVGRLPFWRRWQIAAVVPFVLERGERMMLRPQPWLTQAYRIPRSALEEAYGRGSGHRERVRAIVAPVYRLLRTPA